MRYDQLLSLVMIYQPRSILEIGTWNGHRAMAMLSIVPRAKYYGFDLFEDATPETDAAEMNVKPHHSIASVREMLRFYDVQLFKGNTRDTLKDFNQPVDFVWLDGGHSVETIRSDWENVRRCVTPESVILFDDYYSGPIDTEKYGCNKIVEELHHKVLPQADPVSGGGWVRMARVFLPGDITGGVAG